MSNDCTVLGSKMASLFARIVLPSGKLILAAEKPVCLQDSP